MLIIDIFQKKEKEKKNTLKGFIPILTRMILLRSCNVLFINVLTICFIESVQHSYTLQMRGILVVQIQFSSGLHPFLCRSLLPWMDTFPITPFNFPFYLFYFSDLIRHIFDPALLFVSYLFLTLLGNHIQPLYPHRHLLCLRLLIGSCWKELAYYSKRFCRVKPCMCA